MTRSRCCRTRSLAAAGLVVVGLAAAPPGATAATTRLTTALRWRACGDGLQCATARVPRNYARPTGPVLKLPVVRKPATVPARRIGSLIVDFGGPGDATTESLRAGSFDVFSSLNDRFDIVGFDPRGTGGTDAIDCKANPERVGPGAQPFPRPATVDRTVLLARDEAYIARCLALNPRILPFVTTANTARDMDRIRRGLGEQRISYFGYSYGTFLGATYETLFPSHVGRFVLDGAVDPEKYLGDPIRSARDQTRAYEVALSRFLHTCASHRGACGSVGATAGVSARAGFDGLVDSMNASPLTARGHDPRPADGDDLLDGATVALTQKQGWPILAQVLSQASHGDGTGVRRLADAAYMRRRNGTYDPFLDRFFAIAAVEGRFPRAIDPYFQISAEDFASFPHFWWNSGYAALASALWPVRPRGAFYGPYSAPRSQPPTLVVGTTFDPATPYADAVSLARQLGNARLLTMQGDGHAAYGQGSRCIDRAVDAYLERGVVPARGTRCRQHVPFQRLGTSLLRTSSVARPPSLPARRR
jgi:pimeloyl-ACP methyl ester carboxylesterase